MFNSLIDKLKPLGADICMLGNKYLYASLKRSTDKMTLLSSESEKSDSSISIRVNSGKMELKMNMDLFVIEAPGVVTIPFGVLFELTADDEIDIELLAFSAEFLHSVNINFSAISLPNFADRLSPTHKLTKSEMEIMGYYYSLMRINARQKVNEHVENNIAASIMAAMVYQQVLFRYKRLGSASTSKGHRASRNAYVHDFIKLVHVHYTKERSVRFYADKLCISPKYLSLLVKEVTGKSAARWIDDLVLMEAKNMLKFSGKNVQQVAYALNFTNQSSFGKFFKHLTGQSPTKYQKT